MTAEHVSNSMHLVLSSLGFGFVMALFVLWAIVWAGAKPGRLSIFFILVCGVIFCASCMAWAQSLHFSPSVEHLKIVALVAACAIIGWLALAMVAKMPPAALLGALALLLVCVFFGALAIWAPQKNLFLLAVSVIVLAALAAFVFICWALIRMNERRPIVFDQSQLPGGQQPDMLPREINRGQLLAAKRPGALQPYRNRS